MSEESHKWAQFASDQIKWLIEHWKTILAILTLVLGTSGATLYMAPVESPSDPISEPVPTQPANKTEKEFVPEVHSTCSKLIKEYDERHVKRYH